MSDRDNITLPREVARLALSYIEWYIENEDGGRFVQVREAEAILRTVLAAEQPKPSEDIEALRRDAERYRWLRDKAPPDIGDMASVRDSHDPSEIDAAIDAAMKEGT